LTGDSVSRWAISPGASLTALQPCITTPTLTNYRGNWNTPIEATTVGVCDKHSKQPRNRARREDGVMATGTALGCIPIDYDINRYWTCSALLLTNDKYGLVLTYKTPQDRRKQHKKHAVIKGKEFNTPDEAYQHALDWVQNDSQDFIANHIKTVGTDDLD
jgi:hypothetical protein